ncbi:hypothetical protein C0991_005710 [Blastosporella zonata]|nr:hypothetical protein C0991_005710 [Blastosporella zonata]
MQQYRPLSIDEDGQEPFENLNLPTRNSHTSYHSGVLWLCIACTAVNVFILLWYPRGSLCDGNSSPFNKKNIHTLRRPSQYVGFDTIPRSSPPIPRNFSNFPFAVAQIDEGEPHKVFEVNSMRFMALSGTVYPEERKVIISNKVSTIMQFRAIDYGMEICELQIHLPPSSASAGEIQAISVYRLESSAPLNLERLSYKTSPQRLGRLGDIRSVPGDETHWHRRISCSLEDVLTVELACPQDIPTGTRCNLEWSQHKEEANPGDFSEQSRYTW